MKPDDVSVELKKELYRRMLLIRRFEEKASECYYKGQLACSTHLYIGEEAVGVGVISHLEPNDYITSTHRGHGHFIAKGGDINRMMAELFGRATGYCKGKGGSMHIADIELGHLGANGIVGGGITIATGAALGIKVRKSCEVVICFFGDGAVNKGEFHESMNFASLHKLPIVFVCENNLYAISTSLKQSSAQTDLAKKGIGYNMPAENVDGMDVLDVYRQSGKAIDQARSGKGPTFLNCKTYRFLGHSRADGCPYRTKKEEERWKSRDPIVSFKKHLLDTRTVSPEYFDRLEEKTAEIIEAAVAYAAQSPYPEPEEALTDVYA